MLAGNEYRAQRFRRVLATKLDLRIRTSDDTEHGGHREYGGHPMLVDDTDDDELNLVS